MSRISIVSLSFSCAVHGGALFFLAGIDTSPPQAPALSGGKGGGEIEVTIVPGGPTGMSDGGFRMADVGKDPASEITPVPVPVPDPVPLAVSDAIPAPDQSPGPRAVSLTSDIPHPPSDIVPVPVPVPDPVPNPVHPTSDIPHPTSEAAGGSTGGEPAGPGTEAPAIRDPASLRPIYPLSCRRLGHAGTAVVRIEIGEDGRPLHVEIARSAGCPELDQAALAAARKAWFRPARSWGRAITCTVEQPILFELRKAG